ncbi:hypothetical protein [Enterococcus gilvus]|uniref:hypothetical protein n=1 Tax=Enterococcus gilvus TaxID=160453 RepID=UPI003ED9ADBF
MIKTNSITTLFLSLSIITSVLSNFFNVLSNTDEILTIIYLLFICFMLFRNKGSIDEFYLYCVSIIIITTVIGIASNHFSLFSIDVFSKNIDILLSMKLLITFTFFYGISFYDTKEYINEKLGFFAKIFILYLFIIGTISQFVFNDMVLLDKRYGLYPFKFVYNFAGDLGFLIIALMIIIMFKKDKLNFNDYIFILLGGLTIFETTKIQVMVFPIALFAMGLFKKMKMKINMGTFFVVGVILFIAGYSQLQDYFFDPYHYSPRKIMLLDSLRLANRNFPIGTGFGSFGSEMAARYYSPLYYSLGYNNLHGLDGNANFSTLNDNYLAMLLAQLGWIGALLYYSIFFLIAKYSFCFKKNRQRLIAISTIITYTIASIGSGSIKSSAGVIGFGFLGVILSDKKKQNKGTN